MSLKERLLILSIVIVMFGSMAYVQYAHAYPVNCYYNSQVGTIECHRGSD